MNFAFETGGKSSSSAARKFNRMVLVGTIGFLNTTQTWSQSLPEATSSASAANITTTEAALTPGLFTRILARQNAEILNGRLAVKASDNLRQAEAGLYEPVAFASIRQEGRFRQNTVEEQLVSSGLPYLQEKVNTRILGIKSLMPSGGEVNLSYQSVQRRSNVIQTQTTTANYGLFGFDTEYTSALTISLKQPLLKGFGRNVTETDKRVADINFEVSKEQFKQQIFKSTTDGLNIYWQLYKNQQILAIRTESVAQSKKLYLDTIARIEAGKVPASASLEVQSMTLNREIELGRANQSYIDAKNKLLSTLNVNPSAQTDFVLYLGASDPRYSKPDDLETLPITPAHLENWPAFKIAALHREEAQVKMEFLDNQKKPALDFVISASGTGFDSARQHAMSLSASRRYPDWFIGLNFEEPIYGNQKAKEQYLAQSVRVTQAELEMTAIQTTYANELNSFMTDVKTSLQVTRQSESEVALRKQIYDNEFQRYTIGSAVMSTVIQKDSDLLDSKVRMLENQVKLEFSKAELLLYQGALLKHFGILLDN